jgi:hypothetical protein
MLSLISPSANNISLTYIKPNLNVTYENTTTNDNKNEKKNEDPVKTLIRLSFSYYGFSINLKHKFINFLNK